MKLVALFSTVQLAQTRIRDTGLKLKANMAARTLWREWPPKENLCLSICSEKSDTNDEFLMETVGL